MIRAILQSVVEGAIKRFTATGRPGETITDREYMQHYGFTSRPLPGAEGVAVNQGNHYILVATDDRRYRIPVESGEVAIYTDEGDCIHYKRGMEIYIKSGNKLTAEIGNEASITCPVVTVTAATSITLDTPQVTITGDLRVDGDITADGEVQDAGGTKNMSGMRSVYNGHTHNDPQGGATSDPNEEM